MCLKFMVFTVLALGTGCSFVSWVAVKDACRQSNVHCRSDDGGSKSTENTALEMGYEIDKELYNMVVSNLPNEDEEEPIESIPTCKDGQIQVCSTKEGCTCKEQ